MEGQYNLQRSQRNNQFQIAVLERQRKSGEFQVKDGMTLYDETFEEWRSAFTSVLLVSMLSGLMISALRNQEV